MHESKDRSVHVEPLTSRRHFLQDLAIPACLALPAVASGRMTENKRAQVAITLDLEMCAQYPKRGMVEWNYEKGNLDKDTKEYALKAAKVAESFGARIHFFCVGRVLEQEDVSWLAQLAEAGHPIGNHTYDHVFVLAKSPQETQFRFQRAPWLIEGQSTQQILEKNISMTSVAMKQRIHREPNGFRTPGGFTTGLEGREDVQKLLLRCGFDWVSSKYDGPILGDVSQEPTESHYQSIVESQKRNQPFIYPTGLIEIPMSPVSDVNAFRSLRWKLDWFLESIRRSLEWTLDNNAVYDFLAHPSCLSVEDPECKIIELICRIVAQSQNRGGVTTLDKIAASIAAN